MRLRSRGYIIYKAQNKPKKDPFDKNHILQLIRMKYIHRWIFI